MLKIASSKEISAKLLIVICFVYPLLYYIRLMQWVSLDQWLMGVRVLNFCVKSIFCQVIQDCYVDILDSSYFVIQNQVCHIFHLFIHLSVELFINLSIHPPFNLPFKTAKTLGGVTYNVYSLCFPRSQGT